RFIPRLRRCVRVKERPASASLSKLLRGAPEPDATRMTANLIRERAGNAPFVQPYLHALDRMQKRAFLHPEQVVARARTLLDERLGTSAHPAEAVFAPAGAGIPAEHTHYFDGFALLLMLPLGTAVAVRRAEGPASQVAFEGSEATWRFDRAGAAGEAPGWPAWARLVEQL